MSDRVDCQACGADIMAATAERTGGFCVPCERRGGQRQLSPAERIQKYWEVQDQVRTPENAANFPIEAVMWYLNDKRECLGSENLTPAERMITRLREFRGYGPESYFQYQLVEEFAEIVEDLHSLGCPEMADLLERCMKVIVKGRKVPRNRDKFDLLVDKLHGESEDWQKEVEVILNESEQIEGDFWAKLDAHILAYAKSHDIPTDREQIAAERREWFKKGTWRLPV